MWGCMIDNRKVKREKGSKKGKRGGRIKRKGGRLRSRYGGGTET